MFYTAVFLIKFYVVCSFLFSLTKINIRDKHRITEKTIPKMLFPAAISQYLVELVVRIINGCNNPNPIEFINIKTEQKKNNNGLLQL